jgi:hypothetical protein
MNNEWTHMTFDTGEIYTKTPIPGLWAYGDHSIRSCDICERPGITSNGHEPICPRCHHLCPEHRERLRDDTNRERADWPPSERWWHKYTPEETALIVKERRDELVAWERSHA